MLNVSYIQGVCKRLCPVWVEAPHSTEQTPADSVCLHFIYVLFTVYLHLTYLLFIINYLQFINYLCAVNLPFIDLLFILHLFIVPGGSRGLEVREPAL